MISNVSYRFLVFVLHLPSSENQIDKIESTKAWGKSPFVTSTDAYTQAHIILTYTFFKSIYASLNFHMCLQNMTPPKFLWVLCCVRYDKIVSVFFSFFFLYFQFLLHYFSCLGIFFSKVVFHKKETKYKKEIPVLLVCKFLLIKGDGQLDRHTDKQISWLINTNYRCEKEVKYFLCYTARMVKKWLQLFFFPFLHRAV